MKKNKIIKTLALTLGILILPIAEGGANILNLNNTFIEKVHAATSIGEYVDSQNITYVLFDDGTARIKGGTYSGGKYTHKTIPNVSDIVIPATIDYEGNTYTVNRILSGAFADISTITSVKLPTTANLTIDDSVFSGTSITSLTLKAPMNLRPGAFKSMKLLETVTIADGQQSIPSSLFAYCSKLHTVNLPNTINSIGEYAFDSTNISNLDISYVDDLNAKSLSGIPESCTIIANGTTFIEDGTLYSKNKKKLVKVIDKSQISDTLTLDGDLEEIGEYAFQNTSGFTTVNIGENVKSIGDYAFDKTSIINLNFATNSKLTTIGKFAFRNCVSLKEAILPETLITIDNYCFYGDTDLTKVTMYDNVTSLGNGSFKDCAKLETLKLSNNIATLTGETFWNCDSLAELILPSNLTKLSYGSGSNDYLSCKNLQYIKGPVNVVRNTNLANNKSSYSSYEYKVYFYDEDNTTVLGAYWVKKGTDMSNAQDIPIKLGQKFVRWVPKLQSLSTLDNIVSDTTFIAEYIENTDSSLNPKLETPILNISKLNPNNRENISMSIQ